MQKQKLRLKKSKIKLKNKIFKKMFQSDPKIKNFKCKQYQNPKLKM